MGLFFITDADFDTNVGADSESAPTEPAPTEFVPPMGRWHGLPEIVRQFKRFSAWRINDCRGTRGVPVWQRDYYEHIIHHEQSLNCIREYIMTHPLRGALDRENPERDGTEAFEQWLDRFSRGGNECRLWGLGKSPNLVPFPRPDRRGYCLSARRALPL